MHLIDLLEPNIRAAVRDEVYLALRAYASGGNHDRVPLGQVYLKVAQGLAEKGVIERSSSGRYTSLKTHYHTQGFPNYGVLEPIANLIRQTFWDLFSMGLLSPGSNLRSNQKLVFQLDLDICMITPYGVQVLIAADNRIRVHDPDGYLELFRSASPPADPEMMRYLMESISVFRSNHLLATVLLLGSASERLIEGVAEQLRDSLGTTKNGENWFKAYRKKWTIIRKYDELIKTIRKEYANELKAERIGDREFNNLKITFEAIRSPRNTIAHQHDYIPTWNEAGGLLHNFTFYFNSFIRIIEILLANPR